MWEWFDKKKQIATALIALVVFGYMSRGHVDHFLGTEVRIHDSMAILIPIPVLEFKQDWQSTENIEDSRMRSMETRMLMSEQRTEELQRAMARMDAQYAQRLEIAEEYRNTFLERDSIRSTLKYRVVALTATTAKAMVDVSSTPDSLVPVEIEEVQPAHRRGIPILRSIGRNHQEE